MNRRQCMTLGLLAAIAGQSLVSKPAQAGIQSRLGLQLFLVRSLMQKDVRATLHELARIGFSEIEMFGFGGSLFGRDPLFGLQPEAWKALLEELRLTIERSDEISSVLADLGL